MATVYDVAAHAGVSIATVSRALNERSRISAATRSRVLAAAAELGYLPNDVARSLVGKTTQTIALFLADIANPFFPELVKGVQTVADDNGHLLLLCHTGDDEEKALRDLVRVRRKQVDGVIIVAGDLGGERIAQATAGLPVVMMDRDLAIPNAALVTVDHRAGARAGVEHLIGLGHRDIAHIGGPPHISASGKREAGWADALRAAGLTPDPRLLIAGDFTEDGGYAAGTRLLEAGVPFTAVFTANDLTAIGLLAALTAHGVRVPRDVSVVGFDGIHLTAYTTPPLTTIAQPIFDLGRRAADLLIARLTGPQHADWSVPALLDTRLLVRASSGPVDTSVRTLGKGRADA